MTKKLIKTLLILTIILLSIANVFAEDNLTDTTNYSLSDTYQDEIASIVNADVDDDIINIYFFYGDGCPHCAKEEEVLATILQKYSNNVRLYSFECWYNDDNVDLYIEATAKLGFESNTIPLTIIGDQHLEGFNSATTESDLERIISGYLGNTDQERIYTLPLIGEIHAKNASLLLVATVLGIVDGFNPCAMWVLLFLINMLIRTKSSKKMFILGFTFLFTSAFVYFLSMLGMNFILSVTSIIWIRRAIAIFAMVFGLMNIYNYHQEKQKDDGCQVVDTSKRKKFFTKINSAIEEPHIIIAMLIIIGLAASVNLVELACSLGFPAIFAEILAINNVSGILRIGYLLIYVFFYMLDDMIIFIIAMKTFEVTGISTKYTKYSHLIGGAIMLIIGLLLLFRPDIIMFSF